MDRGARGVLTNILLLVDAYDLYGRVAVPKNHRADEVPQIYRLAASRRGVFINPALTEPFGLTLLEAAASGLPIVATEDGGECVSPSVDTAIDRSYPIARPLFMYTSPSVIAEKPQVAEFIAYYLNNVNDLIGEVGYFPAPADALQGAADNIKAAAGW